MNLPLRVYSLGFPTLEQFFLTLGYQPINVIHISFIFIYLSVSLCVFACTHVCVSLSPSTFLPLSVFDFVSVSLGKQGQLSKNEISSKTSLKDLLEQGTWRAMISIESSGNSEARSL